MGAEVVVEGLTKSFGRQTIWRDVTLTLPPGEVSVMLGPSGTGKSVFLKSMIGLLKPDRGQLRDQRRRHRHLLGAQALRDPQALRRALPGRRAVRLDEPLRQRRLPAARAHEEVRGRDPPDRAREARHDRPGRRGAQAPRRDLRRHAQARRPRPRAGAGPRDHPVRRAGLGPRPGPHVLHLAAADRPQRADRRHDPDRLAQHQPRPDRAGQHRHAVPPRARHVRPPRGAADQRGAGRQAVPQRQPHRPDRHVRGEGRGHHGRRAGAGGGRSPRRRHRRRERRRPADRADAGAARAAGRAPPQGPGHVDHRHAAPGRPRTASSSR